MKAIAATTGGRTAAATNTKELASFYRRIGSSIGHTTETRDIASWFALAAAVLLVGAVALGRAWGSALG